MDITYQGYKNWDTYYVHQLIASNPYLVKEAQEIIASETVPKEDKEAYMDEQIRLAKQANPQIRMGHVDKEELLKMFAKRRIRNR